MILISMSTVGLQSNYVDMEARLDIDIYNRCEAFIQSNPIVQYMAVMYTVPTDTATHEYGYVVMCAEYMHQELHMSASAHRAIICVRHCIIRSYCRGATGQGGAQDIDAGRCVTDSGDDRGKSCHSILIIQMESYFDGGLVSPSYIIKYVLCNHCSLQCCG